MKDYNKKYNLVLLIAILTSVGFPVGIVMLVMGALHDYNAVMVFGIIFTVAGFYGTPIVWAAGFRKAKRRRGLFNRINGKPSVEISALSTSTGKRSKLIIKDLRAMVISGYFTEYSFDKEYKYFQKQSVATVTAEPPKPTETKDEKGVAESIKCSSCGAIFTLHNGVGQCPYCCLHYKK